MALAGVETGKMTATEAARLAAIAGGTGSTPAAWAIAMMTGMEMFAAAVLDIVSERIVANTAEANVRGCQRSDRQHPRKCFGHPVENAN